MEALTNIDQFKSLSQRLPDLKTTLEGMIDELKVNMDYLQALKDKKPKDNTNPEIIKLREDNFVKLNELSDKRVEMKEKGKATITVIDEIKMTIQEVCNKFDSDKDNLLKANNEIINEIIERKREENKKEIYSILENIKKEIKKIKDAEKKYEEEKKLWDSKRVEYFQYQRKFEKDYKEHYKKLTDSQKEENSERRAVMKSLGINENIFIEVKELQKKSNETLLSKYPNITKNIPKLEEWCGSKLKSVIYNSDFDGLNPQTFLEKVLYHSKIYFLIIDDKNNIFGHFHSTEIVEVGSEILDPNMFLFTIFSNGRKKIEKYPNKSEKKNTTFTKIKSYYSVNGDNTGYEISSLENKGLIHPGVGQRFKGAEQNIFAGFSNFKWSKIIVMDMESSDFNKDMIILSN